MNEMRAGTDIQRSFRLPIELLVELRKDKQSSEEFCANLSIHGIFVSTNTPEPVGTSIELCFSLPHNQKKLSITGIVMWERRDIDGPGPFGMGLRFNTINETELAALEEAIAHYRTVLENY